VDRLDIPESAKLLSIIPSKGDNVLRKKTMNDGAGGGLRTEACPDNYFSISIKRKIAQTPSSSFSFYLSERALRRGFFEVRDKRGEGGR